MTYFEQEEKGPQQKFQGHLDIAFTNVLSYFFNKTPFSHMPPVSKGTTAKPEM